MKRAWVILYIIIQLLLYLSIVFIDIKISHNLLTYLVIVINMIMGVLTLVFKNNKDVIISIFALFFTLVSDTFLIFTEHLTIAMISFSVVQTLYMIKVKNLKYTLHKFTKMDLTRSIIIPIVMLITIILFKDLLITITSIYFLMLVFNFIESIHLIKSNMLIPIGFCLFILCDIFVGLNFLKDILPIENFKFLSYVININFNFIWFFYTPSQVLLTLSIYK